MYSHSPAELRFTRTALTCWTFAKLFRDVCGDYFDIIEPGGNRTPFAIVDVSGKGMPAALLAANVQALVRSIASVEADPAALASCTIGVYLCPSVA